MSAKLYPLLFVVLNNLKFEQWSFIGFYFLLVAGCGGVLLLNRLSRWYVDFKTDIDGKLFSKAKKVSGKCQIT